MKTVRVILSVLAVVLALSGAMAGAFIKLPPAIGYEFIPGTGGAADRCVERETDCQVNLNTPCTWTSGNDLRDNPSASQCGAQLKRNP